MDSEVLRELLREIKDPELRMDVRNRRFKRFLQLVGRVMAEEDSETVVYILRWMTDVRRRLQDESSISSALLMHQFDALRVLFCAYVNTRENRTCDRCRRRLRTFYMVESDQGTSRICGHCKVRRMESDETVVFSSKAY